ncbi:hypothetical protein Tco_1344349 [Tanacetum coccineum]
MRTIDQSTGVKLRDKNVEESLALLKDLALYDNESCNDPKDFAKPVKAISLPQDVPITSDCRLIKLKNQVQHLMDAHLARKSSVQVNKITFLCEICSGPHDTQYCMKNPEQALVDYASSRTIEAGVDKMKVIDGMDDDLFTHEVEIPRLSRIPCDKKDGDDEDLDVLARLMDVTVEQWLDLIYGDHKKVDVKVTGEKQWVTRGIDADMEYDPSDVEFAEWLALKFYNHNTMDRYTKNALWVYWTRGDDEVEFNDEEFSDPYNENLIDKDEVGEILKIETDVFDFETPICKAFDEFNYLLNIDTDLLTSDILGFKTYDEFKNKMDGRMKQRNTMGWNDEEDIHEERQPNNDHGIDNFDNDLVRDNASYQASDEECEEDRCELLRNPHQEPSVCEIRRFKMIKYSFGPLEKYIAIKECEYDDLKRTEDDACHAYQQIFHIIDEGWFVTRAG